VCTRVRGGNGLNVYIIGIGNMVVNFINKENDYKLDDVISQSYRVTNIHLVKNSQATTQNYVMVELYQTVTSL
jgi:hypothetical protein